MGGKHSPVHLLQMSARLVAASRWRVGGGPARKHGDRNNPPTDAKSTPTPFRLSLARFGRGWINLRVAQLGSQFVKWQETRRTTANTLA